MITSWIEFYKAVEKMRSAQKEFFRTRSPSDLNASKKIEAEVDEAIKRHNERERNRNPVLPFGEQKRLPNGMPVFSALQKKAV